MLCIAIDDMSHQPRSTLTKPNISIATWGFLHMFEIATNLINDHKDLL